MRWLMLLCLLAMGCGNQWARVTVTTPKTSKTYVVKAKSISIDDGSNGYYMMFHEANSGYDAVYLDENTTVSIRLITVR